ncbi:MAG: S8 family serine peptidase [Barnesiella sp.]|nr:S8 family serine peptidase [Barnesiella sp.]
MKRLIPLALLMGLSITAPAQHKINPAGRRLLKSYHSSTAMSRGGGVAADEPTISMIIRTNDENAARMMADSGYTVTADLGSIALIKAPITAAERIAESKAVRSVSFGNKRRMLMKATRDLTGINDVHDGININGTTSAFTGEGVVLGLMDGGLYPNHLNFQGRVERLWHFDYNSSKTTEYTASNISNFSTDDKEATHATHVAGIMTGGYMGTATFGNNGQIVSGRMPHYGVAPDATLAFSCGDLYDEYIIQGVQNIVEYAEAQGKPVAVNLSLGSNGGPHDGSDALCTALDELGKRAIICVAAGNEGADDLSLEKTFTASDRTLRTMPFYNSNYANSHYGQLDIWSDSEQSFTVTIGTVDSEGNITNETTIPTSTNGEELQLSRGVRSGSNNGGVYYCSGVDESNGRYMTYFYFDQALPSTGRFAITVTGNAGQTVNLWFDGYSTFTNRYYADSNPLDGFSKGSPDASINSMACGKNVLSVGAYCTTTSWTRLSGSTGTNYESEGAHASFSSYGRDFSGRHLPEISAPGTTLISSFSSAYVEGGYGADYGESASDMVAKAGPDTATDYWGPMDGTSMATPVATGTMGLWLQADPTLTIDRVREIIKATSTRDNFVEAAPDRFGAGKINAAKGIEYILSKAALEDISTDTDRVSVSNEANALTIVAAGASDFTASLFDLQGRTALSATSSSSTLNINTSQLAPGLYILRLQGNNLNYSTKIAIR